MLRQSSSLLQRAATARELWGTKPGRRGMGAAAEGKRVLALWGNGDYGRLGLGKSESQWVPTVCTLQTSEPTAVACGGAHTLLLTDEGRVYATGLNDWGQLGVALATGHSEELVEVKGLPNETRFVHIAAGDFHSAAVSEDGGVYVWGRNTQGQLGLGKRAQTKVWAAQRLEALKDLRIKMLALGSEHSIALSEEGEVLSWGSSLNGRLGHGDGHRSSSMFSIFRKTSEYSPRMVKGLQDVKVRKIAAGLMHSACLDEQGSMLTFGKGRECQLGLGNDRDCAEPMPVPVIPPVEDIACGGYHTGAISLGNLFTFSPQAYELGIQCVVCHGNGQLYTWGSNEYGCLGFGYKHQLSTSLPMRVEGTLTPLRVTEVACGWKHTMALAAHHIVDHFHYGVGASPIKLDGRIFTWGWGGSQGTHSGDGRSSGGQLGLADENDYLEPTLLQLKGSMRGLQVSCGFNHSGAILEEH